MLHHQPSDLEIRPDPDWPDWLKSEFEANQDNARVGTQLLSESERVRVWHLEIKPGERLPVHRHVLDYFWTALTPGKARSHYHGGRDRRIPAGRPSTTASRGASS